jgi:hypothetical protein
MPTKQNEADAAPPARANDRSLKLRLLNAGMAGMLASALLLIVVPNTPKFESPIEKYVLVVAIEKVFHLINSLPFALIAFACLVLFAIYRYRRQDARGAAFVAGMILTRIVLYLISPGLIT